MHSSKSVSDDRADRSHEYDAAVTTQLCVLNTVLLWLRAVDMLSGFDSTGQCTCNTSDCVSSCMFLSVFVRRLKETCCCRRLDVPHCHLRHAILLDHDGHLHRLERLRFDTPLPDSSPPARRRRAGLGSDDVQHEQPGRGVGDRRYRKLSLLPLPSGLHSSHDASGIVVGRSPEPCTRAST